MTAQSDSNQGGKSAQPGQLPHIIDLAEERAALESRQAQAQDIDAESTSALPTQPASGPTSPRETSEEGLRARLLSGLDDDEVVPPTITERLEDARRQRQQWEAAEHASSRKRLHYLLRLCYEICLDIVKQKDKDVREQRTGELILFVTNKEQLRKRLPVTQMAVLAVFGGQSKQRISAYGKTLTVALTAGPGRDPVQPEELADWIVSQGGVEEIRTGSKNAGVPPAQRAKLAQQDMKKVLATVTVDQSDFAFDANDYDEDFVLIGTYRSKGELEIRAVVRSDAAVTTARMAYYSAHRARLQPPKVPTATHPSVASHAAAAAAIASSQSGGV